MTTVGKLIDALEELDRETEIRIMHQESYPLQETIGGIWTSGGEACAYDDGDCGYTRDAMIHFRSSDDYDHDFLNRIAPDAKTIVYLVANGHPQHDSPYGDRRAWEEMESVR